ncbi:hypothetical protein [Humibacter sp.]|uniref:hypothetical protein n=1 Tax=Humibacter sp. TaxID=1940291 RepID=UPI003F821A2B
MATVSSHQQGAFSNPQNGQTGDAAVVLANDNALRATTNAHDADATIHIQSSVLASRPAAGTAGRPWITTDGLRFYMDSGSAWGELAYLPLVGGTLTGPLTGGLTVSTGGVTVSASGITVTGNSTIAGTLGSLTGLTVGGSGITVSAGGVAITGNSNITGTLGSLTGLTVGGSGITVSAGGIAVNAGTTAVQALTATTGTFSTSTGLTTVGRLEFAADGVSPRLQSYSTKTFYINELGNPVNIGGAVTIATGGLTVSASGAAITGNSTVTGTLGVSSAITVSAGGIAVTGNSTITGTLSGLTGLTVASGGITVTAGDVTLSSGQLTTSGVVKAAVQGMFGAYNGTGDAGSIIVSNDTSASATAGAASLPAAPVGFFRWHLGATVVKIPYYAS